MTRHTIPRQHAVPYHKTALDKHRRYPTMAHNTRHHNPTAATRHHTTQRNATRYDQQQKQLKPRHGTASARHRRTPPNATQRNSTAHTTTRRNATTTLHRGTQRRPTRRDEATRIRNAAPQTTIKKAATRLDLTPHLMCRSTSTWLLLTDDKEPFVPCNTAGKQDSGDADTKGKRYATYQCCKVHTRMRQHAAEKWVVHVQAKPPHPHT